MRDGAEMSGAMALGAVAFSVGCWYASRSVRALDWLGTRFVVEQLAVVEARFVPFLRARFRRQLQLSALMALLAALVAASLMFVPIPEQGVWFLVPMAVFAAIVNLASGGLFAWEAQRTLDQPDGASRTARSRAVGVDDLVPRLVRMSAWGAAACSVAVTVTAAATGRLAGAAAGAAGAAAVYVIAIAVSLGAAELASRRAAASSARAGDSAQLYWQDALRAEPLANCYAQSLWLAANGWAVVGGVVVLGPTEDGSRLLAVVWGAGLVCLIGVQVATLLLALARPPWFRRRLWPELAPGEVLLPGRQAGVS